MRPSEPGVVPASSFPMRPNSHPLCTWRDPSELIPLCDQVNLAWSQRAHSLCDQILIPYAPGVIPASSSPYATKSTWRGPSELIALCDQVNRTWFQRAHRVMRPSQPDVVPASSSPHATKSTGRGSSELIPSCDQVIGETMLLAETPAGVDSASLILTHRATKS